MKTIQARIPDQLYRQIEALVKNGRFQSREEVVHYAVRRFLESQGSDMTEKFIREDIDWGLHGKR